MILVGKTALILRGYDQSSTLKDNELQAGEMRIIKPDVCNSHDSHAVMVENNRGFFGGRVAKEQAQGCYRMLQQIKSLGIQHKANFNFLAIEQHRYFQSTSVHIEVNYFVDENVDGHFYDNKMKELEEKCYNLSEMNFIKQSQISEEEIKCKF